MRTFAILASLLLAALPAQAFDPVSLDALLSQPAVAQSHVGLEVRSLDGKILYSRDACKLFTPASVQKLLTSVAALRLLGPETRFRTELLLEKNGGLVLKGYGDPSLRSSDLDAFAAALLEKGPQRYGDLVVDSSLFSDPPYPPGWMNDDLPCDYAPPVSALTIEENVENERPLASPPLHAGKLLLARLQKAGIFLSGKLRTGRASPEAQTIFTHLSPPLRELLVTMNKHSDNLYAETLLMQLGKNREEGLEKESALLTSIGWEKGGFRLADGSGLSRYNALTPSQLAGLLCYASALPESEVLKNSLPIAGVDGTLAKRWVGSPVAGRLFAKTGTMSGVSCLAGYLEGKQRMAIALMVNGFPGSAAGLKKWQDSLIEALLN